MNTPLIIKRVGNGKQLSVKEKLPQTLASLMRTFQLRMDSGDETYTPLVYVMDLERPLTIQFVCELIECRHQVLELLKVALLCMDEAAGHRANQHRQVLQAHPDT